MTQRHRKCRNRSLHHTGMRSSELWCCCSPYAVFWDAPSRREYRGGAPGAGADEIFVAERDSAVIAYLLRNGRRNRR